MAPDKDGQPIPSFGRKIEIRHLRYAMTAAHHGSFRRAAEALCIEQSTLSRGISQLEACLGVVLFERGSSGVRPTTAGTEIVRTSRHLVDTIDHMVARAREIRRGHFGRLTVGFYTSLSSGNLRASLIEYAARFPTIEMRTVEGSRSRLFNGLAGGLIDIAIITGDGAPSDGRAMALWTERIMVALPENHRLCTREVVDWTDLKEETLLISQHDPGPEIQGILSAKLAVTGKPPTVICHHASHDNIKSLVSAGFGVGLMLEAWVTDTSHAGVVYREACDGNGPSRLSYCAYWSADNQNPALARFIALLEERYASRTRN